jgi:hypothetical protein
MSAQNNLIVPPLNQVAFSVIDLRLTERWFREGFGLLPAGGSRFMMRGVFASRVRASRSASASRPAPSTATPTTRCTPASCAPPARATRLQHDFVRAGVSGVCDPDTLDVAVEGEGRLPGTPAAWCDTARWRCPFQRSPNNGGRGGPAESHRTSATACRHR